MRDEGIKENCGLRAWWDWLPSGGNVQSGRRWTLGVDKIGGDDVSRAAHKDANEVLKTNMECATYVGSSYSSTAKEPVAKTDRFQDVLEVMPFE